MSQLDNSILEDFNGRIFCNHLLPLHLFLHIIEHLDPISILQCRSVCKFWRDATETALKQEYRRRFSLSADNISLRYLLIRLYTDIFNTNMLQNCCGEDRFNHWNILAYRSRFKIENLYYPNDVPEVPECYKNCCFVVCSTSTLKEQVILVKENSNLEYILNYNPIIYAAEWIMKPSDHRSKYEIEIVLTNEYMIKARAHKLQIIEDCKGEFGKREWIKVETRIEHYPTDITEIHFQHSTEDKLDWLRLDGLKMTGSVLKLLPTL